MELKTSQGNIVVADSIDCYDAAKVALAAVIKDLVAQGFNRAEIALAIADSAEDYVLDLASHRTSAHH
ncbi:hypothetical protein [Neorhizobium alkalisoli]|jgi:hypothetical protein|uniref:Uncharacterized protein n=1 Tax=Neorhizobium alkalisoli TaxID=528178 RepID=A0A561R1E5_9HYPH|nr:hypothetical protein [Neorhizobium alkalisoli]TWF56441.1 hypothetical protein FHW37_10269 [Neorhizobium alkalisoli]